MQRKVLLLLGPVAVLLVGLWVGTRPLQAQVRDTASGAGAPDCVPAWNIVASPPITTGTAVLNAVVSLSATNIWAVGYTRAATDGDNALLLHWNGTAWSRFPPPVTNGQYRLYGVAASAPNDVWAVGSGYGNATETSTLILHWDGQAWSRVASPDGRAPSNHLRAVTSRAANDVWAVGDSDEPLVLHWDGMYWGVVSLPAVAVAGTLYDVKALAANNVWAVGYYYETARNTASTLIVHWDGTAWSQVASPNLGSGANTLRGLGVVSSTDLWAVGYYRVAGAECARTLIQHWNGTAWSVVASPNNGPRENILFGVAVGGATDIWAVGSAYAPGGTEQTLTLHWDGSAWTPAASPNTGAVPNRLAGVTLGSGGELWAVGYGGDQPLVERYSTACVTPAPTVTPLPTPSCGASWGLVPHPEEPLTTNLFYGVAATGPNDVWAVGSARQSSYTLRSTLIEHWTGSGWNIATNPGFGDLYGVAARTTTDAWAVGDQVLHWDGTAWTLVPTPNTGFYSTLYGVSMVAANDVWAVGSRPEGNTRQPLTIHWDGLAWSQVPAPTFTSTQELRAVAARTADDVWAVGGYDTSLTLHWDGQAWTQIPSPSVPGGVNKLYGVAIVAANDVWAVGTGELGPSPQPLIIHWNGVAWSQVPAAPISASTLTAVTALAANDVWAVGSGSAGTFYTPLVEHWDGSGWQVVPSENTLGAVNILWGVAAASTGELWAVGQSYAYPNYGSLIERFTRPCSGPTVTPTPSAPPTATRTVTVPPTLTPTPPPTTTAHAGHFEDVPPPNPFYTYVECLVAPGVIGGYPCGGPGEPCVGPTNKPYYRPNNPVTRGQISKIIAESAQFADAIPSTQWTFEDVPGGSTFWLWVERLAVRGIIGGYPCGGPGEPCIPPNNRPYFRPNANVTRGQLSKITSLAAGYTETPTTQTFEDVPPGSPFYLYIERMAARTIVGGYPCGGPFEPCQSPGNRPYFRPGNNATRAQMSKIAAQAFFPGCTTAIRR